MSGSVHGLFLRTATSLAGVRCLLLVCLVSLCPTQLTRWPHLSVLLQPISLWLDDAMHQQLVSVWPPCELGVLWPPGRAACYGPQHACQPLSH